MDEPMPIKRKRRRRTLACEECRRRKVRCDREQPCANCVQAYKPEHCFYMPDPMMAKSPPPRPPPPERMGSPRMHHGPPPHHRDPADPDAPLPHHFGGSPYHRHRGGHHRGGHGRHHGHHHHHHIHHYGPRSMDGEDLPLRAGSISSSSGFSSIIGGGLGRGPSGSMETEWPGASQDTFRRAGDTASVASSSRFNVLPAPNTNSPRFFPPHQERYSHADYDRAGAPYPTPGSTNRGPLPGFSTVSGESEVVSLKEQVRRLESRLASVLDDQEQQQPKYNPGSASGPGPTSSPQQAPPPPMSLPPPSALHLPLPRYDSFRVGSDNPDMPSKVVDRSSAKARYISQGHWMNGALLTVMPLVSEILGKKENRNAEMHQAMRKCKSLARAIKARRIPSMMAFEFGKQVPPKEIADELVNSYFRTFETVYRVLHIPTFTQDYRRYWENPSAASPNFVIQMQLCMAIGTCFYDDTCSQRHLATQWIYEAQIWLMTPMPSEKSRMSIPGLQTQVLLHLAREISGVGGDLVWISAGGLVRSAMFMGLHRDPTKIPKVPRFLAEVRRRLWATILEIALQSSLDSGGPPMISLSDYDTLPPANFFDDQLTDKSLSASNAGGGPLPLPAPPSPPKPLSTFTNTSIQIALLKSFPTRLAIARYINDFRADCSYDETLRLNSELRSACQALSGTIQAFHPPAGTTGKMRPTAFQLRFVEHLTQRFFLSLNQAFLAASRNDPKFYFSRKVSVDTSLKLFEGWAGKALPNTTQGAGAGHVPASQPWSVVTSNPSNPTSGTAATAGPGTTTPVSGMGAPPSIAPTLPPASSTAGPASHMDEEPDDFFRLSVSSAGGFRSVPIQCIATLSMELLWQLEEEHAVRLRLGIKTDSTGSSLGARSSPTPDSGPILAMPGVVSQAVLLDALDRAVRFSELRLNSGETNVKGFIFPCAVVSQARALMRGADTADMERTVVQECNEHLQHCVDILHSVAVRPGNNNSGNSGNLKGTGEDDATSLSLGSDFTMASSDMANGDQYGMSNQENMGMEWGWEDLMQDQGFNFSFNLNGDNLFPGI